MTVIPWKRGDTFKATGTYTVSGASADLPTAVASDVRSQDGTLVAALDVTLDQTTSNSLTYTLSADTSGWPLGILQGDVKYTYGDGSIQHTPGSFVLQVTEPYTHA